MNMNRKPAKTPRQQPKALVVRGIFIDHEKAELYPQYACVPLPATQAKAIVKAVNNGDDGMRQAMIDLIRNQERRSDEGWELGVGDLADEYIQLVLQRLGLLGKEGVGR